MKNWTIKEAVATIKAGVKPDEIKEIARINPLFVLAVAKDDVVAIANMMGEKFTVRRLDDGSVAVADNNTNDVVEQAVVEEAGGDVNYEGMSTKELMKLCDKRGIKVPHYGKNKAFYLDALIGSDDAGEAEDGGDEEANPYEGKNAMSLYKMCKDRGIKCEARQKSKVYIDLLVAADNADDEDVEDEDESWVDEAEDEKPAKNVKNTKSKAAAKSNKKAAVADDDEEWDI